jgi:hypothetical protein
VETAVNPAVIADNVVMTCYFTGEPDSQRDNQRWPVEAERLRPWHDSIRGALPVLLHDCFDDRDLRWFNGRVIRTPELDRSPYWFRWWAEHEWLLDHFVEGFIWVTDGTDVRMLNQPWMDMAPGRLYVGAEQFSGTLRDNAWVNSHAHSPEIVEWLSDYGNVPVLNPGTVGGDYDTMLEFLYFIDADLTEMKARYDKAGLPLDGCEEFVLFNQIAYDRFAGRLVFGPQVNTPYKRYVQSDPTAWWAHK